MIASTSANAVPYRIFWSLCLILAAHLTYWGPNSDTMSRNIAALSIALSTDHAIVIDRFVLKMAGGPDKFIDKAKLNGHYYSGMAPGSSILLAPVGLISERIAALAQPDVSGPQTGSRLMTRENFELLLIQLLGTLLVVIPLTAWAWTRLYRHFTEDLQFGVGVSLLAVSAGALCSSIAFYSTYISGKEIAAMLGLLAFTCAYAGKPAEPPLRRLMAAGFFTGAAVATEYTMAIFALCIFAYVAWTRTWRESLWYALGGVVWVLILGWYHTAAFGGPLTTAYHYRWEFEAAVGHTAMPAFSQFSLRRLWGMTFSSYKGIFLYMPWFLAGLAGLSSWLSRPAYRREILLFFAVIIGFLEMLSFSPVWSSSGWGMRYLLPIFPYFAIGLAIWLSEAGKGPRTRALTYGLIGVALAINYLPFGAGEASNWDPPWSAPILYVAGKILRDGFSLYSVEFVARNIRDLSALQRVAMHLIIYGSMFAGLGLIWRKEMARMIGRKQ